jgi:hypothetical protein
VIVPGDGKQPILGLRDHLPQRVAQARYGYDQGRRVLAYQFGHISEVIQMTMGNTDDIREWKRGRMLPQIILETGVEKDMGLVGGDQLEAGAPQPR